MNRVTTIFMGLALLAFCAPSVRGDFVYDVDFENPPHVVGSPPVTGSGSDRPTTVDLVTVSDSVTAFPTQSAFFDSTAGFAGMGFNPDPLYASGIHSISWDMVMLSVMGPDDPQAFVNIVSTDGVNPLVGVELYLDGTVTVTDPLLGATNVTTYTLDEANAFEVVVDLNSDLYDLYIDGNPVLSSMPIESTRDLDFVSFTGGRFGENTFAIDNFQWQIIPEPSTFVLLLVGLGGLLIRRKASR